MSEFDPKNWKRVSPEEEARIKEMAKEGKIRFAEQDKITEYGPEVDTICELLGIGLGGWYSDESDIGDFMPEEKELAELSELIGQPVTHSTRLWWAAEMLRQKNAPIDKLS